ncbi:hypothetical protein [Aureibacillus halotolerans]|uniref:Uncharacterized protein n=1 Tax=Aureibacillus halotolerans TaxID=1508390 RepID=A0A4R6UDI9_9BACI|nr:hypothetical protein [Aureibacillus halotolerans]TDQ41164.1 hypothetical protein EV213_104162 [Aureibacillus halotolerans]
MNDFLLRMYTDQIVAALPDEKRLPYMAAIELENRVAEMNATSDEFINDLEANMPHQQLASQFQMTLPAFLQFVNDIEHDVSQLLETRINQMRWMDYTDVVHRNTGASPCLYFLFVP